MTEKYSSMLEPKSGENEVEFWQRQNKADGAIGLYCQSCCYRYPEECTDIDLLHPHDRAAETCPDFIPKDMYKHLSKAECCRMRFEVDFHWEPLPTCKLWHPIQWWALVPSAAYYKTMTRLKAFNYVLYLKKLEEENTGSEVRDVGE